MDCKGRWMDNAYVERLWRSLKQEEVYRRAYETVGEARKGIARYLRYFNEEGPPSPHILLFNISVFRLISPTIYLILIVPTQGARQEANLIPRQVHQTHVPPRTNKQRELPFPLGRERHRQTAHGWRYWRVL